MDVFELEDQGIDVINKVKTGPLVQMSDEFMKWFLDGQQSKEFRIYQCHHCGSIVMHLKRELSGCEVVMHAYLIPMDKSKSLSEQK
jgi:hypothetical protein